MTVSTALLRFYRPLMVIFGGILVLVEIASVIVSATIAENGFSLWVLIADSAAKYWVLVVGVMVIAMQFRQFIGNGITRHEFLAGLVIFGLILAVTFAVVVPLGHGLESAALQLIGERRPDYPVFTARVGLEEFGRVLPQSLGFFVSGTVIAAAFYRFSPWIGVALVIPGALPLGISQGLLGFDEYGVADNSWPYAVALVSSLLVTLLGAAAIHLLMRDVAIRRTAG
jgi:hypothetical protein